MVNSKNLFLELRQRGYSALKDALNQTILWIIVDHFYRLSSDVDSQEFFGGRRKAAYQFIVRKPKGTDRLSQYNAKIADDEVKKVSSERCCSKHCC